MTRKGKVGLRYSVAKKKLPELRKEYSQQSRNPSSVRFPLKQSEGGIVLAAGRLNSFRAAKTWLGSLGSSLLRSRPCTRAESRQ